MLIKNITLTAPYRTRTALFACGCLSLQALSALGQTPAENGDEDIFELSPFSVSADDQNGYRATSTLAGTRIKTDLKDLGSAISVVTADFLEDTGSTEIKNLLVYTTGTEVGGATGNFAGSGAATADGNVHDAARSDPGASQSSRVRGLSSASLTRNYFLSNFGFDSYNTEMVTISRGPNSILFGVGEPGGIVDSSLKKAIFGRDITKVSARYGSNDSTRMTLDLNRTLVEDRLAMRVNVLEESEKFKQKPAYEDDSRVNVALSATLFKNEGVEWLGKTGVNANWEKARLRGTPVDTVPPQDRYSTWWAPPGSAEADAIIGGIPAFAGSDPAGYRANYAAPNWVRDAGADGQYTTPGNRREGQPHLWGSSAIVFAADGAPRIGPAGSPLGDVQVIRGDAGKVTLADGRDSIGWFPFFSTESNSGPWGDYPGFQNHVIMDTNVWDNENKLLQGHLAYSNHDYEARNVTIEQNFFNNKAGIELAFDRQELSSENWFPLSIGRNSSVKIDVGLFLPNGQPNPNVGRPLISGQMEPVRNKEETYDTKRATAFLEHDFTESDGWTRWLGKHTLSGLYSEWERDTRNWATGLTWDASHDPNKANQAQLGKVGGWGGRMFFLAYIGDPQFGAKTPGDMRFYDNPAQFTLPKVGEFYNNHYYNSTTGMPDSGTLRVRDVQVGAGANLQEINSRAFTLQSKFLNNHLVTTYGWRKDHSQSWITDQVQNSADLSISDASFTNFRNGGNPEPDISDQTRTTQVVFHVPAKYLDSVPAVNAASVHWSESENFNPASVRRDIYGGLIGAPSGVTTEKGITLGLLEDRLNVRLNWYETSSQNFTNNNMQGSLWGLSWPLNYGQRWLNAKNAWIKGTGVAFEDIPYGDPTAAGYKTPEGQAYDPKVIGPYKSYDEVINAVLTKVLPQETINELFKGKAPAIEGALGEQFITSYQGAGSLSTIADLVAEGFEVEAVYNLTQNWRLAFNASKTESTFSNSLKKETPYMAYVETQLRSLGMWDMYEGGATDTPTMGTRWTNEALRPFNAAAAKEGTLNSELVKWRWNAVTNYEFSEGKLSGLGVGGALRWQDKVAVGYPLINDPTLGLIPNLANPYFGDSDMHGDLWFSYKTKLFSEKVPVKFQLNLQNAFGDDGRIPVVVNPDGQVAILRNAPEKRWFFTTTMEF